MNILIKNGIIFTMDNDRKVLSNGAVLIQNDKIAAIGKIDDYKEISEDTKIIDANGKVVLPGFINAHTHLFQTFIRTLGGDRALYDWLENVIWPNYTNMTEDDYYLAALLGCVENIKAGNTSIVDNCYTYSNITEQNVDEIAAKAIEKSGIRGWLALGYRNMPLPWDASQGSMPIKEIISKCRTVIQKWHGKANGRIKIALGPLSPTSTTPELYRETRKLANELKVGIHAHAAETMFLVEMTMKEYGKRNLEYLYDLGCLGPDVQLPHCVWVSDSEIQMLKMTETKVVHNPTSNMYLASGAAPIKRMLDAGVTVALGTDGGANCNQDMLESMKFTACLAKVNALDPTAFTAEQALEMATINGAKALEMEDMVGTLEPGKKADVITINLERAHMAPVLNIPAALVYCANAGDVKDVIIDGNLIMENRKILNINEELLIKKSQKAAERLQERIK
jgi:5-methylthioadenosine/S-adenosylhomocysteine deaminase